MPDAPPPTPDARPRGVWWFTDGKPGHVSQARGLVNALRDRGPLAVTEFDCRRGAPPAAPPPDAGATPPLILAVGRRTHAPALRARRAHGGFAVVLMTPVGPAGQRRRGFDLCVVPEHDGVRPAADVITTVGALNPFSPDGPHHRDRGLILVGGPARRYGWDAAATLQRLRRIVDHPRGPRTWTATSSRRTPRGTEDALKTLHPRVRFTPAADTPRGWVADQLAQSDTVWVTEDSVSMVYEALTAQCRVGLLPVRHRPGFGQRFLGWGPNRVTRGVGRLADQQRVTRFDDWAAGRELTRPTPPLAEAQRVAQILWERWDAHR